MLITSGAVVSMTQGSVIVDLAAEQGGNCALTERDKVVEKFGVKIIGFTDLPSRMARQASELYATTVFNLLEDVLRPRRRQGRRSTSRTRSTAARWSLQDGQAACGRRPTPPAPARGRAAAGKQKPAAAPAPRRAPRPPSKARPRGLGAGRRGRAAARPALFAGGEFVEHLTVFLLACVVGWHVIWNVTPALHTPLMSVTNAISGIILVGGMLLMRGGGIGAADAARGRRHPRRHDQRRGRLPRHRSACCGCSGDERLAIVSVQRARVPRREPALHPQPARALHAGDRAPRQPLRHRRHGRSPSS